MGKTTIEWTDFTVNPIRARLNGRVGHYCEKVSPGCAHCYSSRLQTKFGMPSFAEQRRTDVEVFFDDSKLHEVLRRRIPTRWFWEDMADLFGAWVPDDWIDRCMATMLLTPRHIHQVLTKRAERMCEYFSTPGRQTTVVNIAADLLERGEEYWAASDRLAGRAGRGRFGVDLFLDEYDGHWGPKNVWAGCSVETQKYADERIPWLLKTPAAIRFVSLEPLLGPIDVRPYLCERLPRPIQFHSGRREPFLDWVIVGGESGGPPERALVYPFGPLPRGASYQPFPGDTVNLPHAYDECEFCQAGTRWHVKSKALDWVRSLRDQCVAAGVPFFLKQFGGPIPKSGGRLLDGKEWNEYPS